MFLLTLVLAKPCYPKNCLPSNVTIHIRTTTHSASNEPLNLILKLLTGSKESTNCAALKEYNKNHCKRSGNNELISQLNEECSVYTGQSKLPGHLNEECSA